MLDTHREGAFEVRHFVPVEPEMKRSGNGKKGMSVEKSGGANHTREDAEVSMSAVIALRLFRPALRAVVSMREGKPVRMICLRKKDVAGEIVWTAGPWRSSGDWSEQEGWSREEWDIAVPAESGLVLYRLVQDKLGGQWFVEGTYD